MKKNSRKRTRLCRAVAKAAMVRRRQGFGRARPLVSVIMPVQNGGEYLVSAIESVLSQTYRNFEFLIVDDGSTDNSWRIIQRYKRKHPKLIRVFKTKKRTNAAGNGAVNYALPHARGAYIARMDADDVAHPQRLEKQVKFLNGRIDVILVGTQARVIDKKGKVTGKKSYPLTHWEIYDKYPIVHPIVHPSVMIRRCMLPDPNRIYEMKGDIHDDYYTFFRLLNYGKFANLPEALLDYRIHGKNLSLQNLKERYQEVSRIRKTAVEKFGYRMSLKAKIIIAIQSLMVALMSEEQLAWFYFTIRGLDTGNKKIAKFKKGIYASWTTIGQRVQIAGMELLKETRKTMIKFMFKGVNFAYEKIKDYAFSLL